MAKKNHFWSDLGMLNSNSGHQFVLKNLALPVTRYHGQLSLCTISEKN